MSMDIYQAIKYVVTLFFSGLLIFLTAVAIYNAAPVHQDTTPPSQWKYSKLNVIQLLKDAEYEALTKNFSALQESYANDDASADEVSRAFRSFDFADPALHKRFSEWVSKYPNSFVPYIARGRYLSELALEYRGTNFANKVHPKQIELMIKHFAMAVPDLKRAIYLNPEAVSAYERMMDVQMFTGDHWGVWQTYFVGYFKVADGTPLTRIMSAALEPKWGGVPFIRSLFIRSLFQKFALVAGFFDPGFRVVLDDEAYIAADRATYNGQYEKALALWTDLMATNKSGYIRYRRAWVLRKLKRDDEALRDALIAIDRDPESIDSLKLVASIYANRNLPGKAVSYYSSALKQAPYKPKMLINRAYALSRLNRYDEAIQDLEKALTFGNWSENLLLHRARLLRHPLKQTLAAKIAYVRHFEFGSENANDWLEFTRFLQASRDCDYFQYAPKVLDICLRERSCGRTAIEAQISLANSSSWPSQCTNIPDYSKYFAYFPATTNLDEVTVAGLKPGQGREEILKKFPDALITPIRVGRAQKLFGYQVKRGSLANPPRVIMYTAPDHRIFRIDYMENIATGMSLDDLEKKYTSLYGPPDTRRERNGLELEYRQPGKPGKYAKILTIALRPFPPKKSAPNSDEQPAVQISVAIEDVELRDWTSAQLENAAQADTRKPNGTPPPR